MRKRDEDRLAKRRERTGELVTLIRSAMKTDGVDAARVAVPAFAGLNSVPELAAKLKVNRSALWECLGFHRRQPKHAIRRKLETFLKLAPGGMTEALTLIEALVPEEERKAPK